MTIHFRNHTGKAGITEDYYKIRDFLIESGCTLYTYARWDWMITHDYLDKSKLSRIGIWQDSDKIIGIAVFDLYLGTAYCLTFPAYEFLKREMILYAREHLSEKGNIAIVIPDLDVTMQDIASESGFVATETKEHTSVFYIDRTPIDISLPIGFIMTSMQERLDLYQYYRLLWRGFDHETNGEGPFEFTEKNKASGYDQMIRENVDLSLKIAVVSPDGAFVSYCGLWHDPELDFAVIEPAATDPEYRRMGLAKAAVMEGIKRVKALGAKKVLVGSSQQFYYNIGLRPYASATEWKLRE